MASGYSVKLFLPDGDPSGIKLVEKSNWTGIGLVFPRSLFGKIKEFEEAGRAGVYILAGPGSNPQLPTVYVGEGDPVQPRLDDHFRRKEFWTHAVTFSSKDNNLNKAHIQYLEARLVELANKAKRCEVENGNVPQKPTLSKADQADMEAFLADVLLCLPVLGFGYFEVATTIQAKTDRFKIQSKGVVAYGYETSEGFVVTRGSQVSKEEAPSIHGYLKDQRSALIHQNVLQDRGSFFEFALDYTFNSPSTASGVVLGRSSNGREEWKTAEGRTLKAVQEAWTA
jgi:hypothetical protein